MSVEATFPSWAQEVQCPLPKVINSSSRRGIGLLRLAEFDDALSGALNCGICLERISTAARPRGGETATAAAAADATFLRQVVEKINTNEFASTSTSDRVEAASNLKHRQANKYFSNPEYSRL